MGKSVTTLRLVALGSLCVSTLYVYGGTLSGYFLSDDLAALYTVVTWAGEGHLLSQILHGFLAPPYRATFFYRPLVDGSFAADYAVWGVNPLGWRLTNLLLHLVNALLLWSLVERLTRGVAGRTVFVAAGAAAAMFVVRPSSPETVVWPSGRSDSLALLGMLSGFLAYLRADGRWGRWYLVAVGAFLFALASKEAGVTTPGGLLALHICGAVRLRPKPGEPCWRAWVRQTLGGVSPFGLILLAYFAWRLFLFGSAFMVYRATLPIAFSDPAWWALKLHALQFFFTPAIVRTPLSLGFSTLVALQLLVGVGAAWLSATARRVWLFGICWLLATLLPLMKQLAIAATGADARLLYIPGAALVVVLAVPLVDLSLVAQPGDPLRRGIFRLGVVGSLLLIVLSIPLLDALLRPWQEAGQSMNAVPPAIAARAMAVPAGDLAILLLPDQVDGALFARNCQGALMAPPVQAHTLSDRVLVVTPPTLQELAPRLTTLPGSQREYWCWQVTAQHFERLDVSVHSSDTWLEAWTAALHDSPCQALAEELVQLRR